MTFDFRKPGIILYGEGISNHDSAGSGRPLHLQVQDGYSAGFVTENSRGKSELLQIAELNTGFDVPYWYRGQELTQILQDEHGCYVDSLEITQRVDADPGRLVPLCFKADVKEPGNYETELSLYGQGEICIFAGPRRLVWKGILSKAQTLTCRFVLNVCDIIPRGRELKCKRRSIDIAVMGRNVRLTTVVFRQKDCPTLYIAGDSTVTDQPAEYPYSPGTSYAGWGQMLSCYMPAGIAVSNHAHSGLTVESFRTEGHYAIIQDNIKAGDYLMLQFGHNDQKLMHLQAGGGYREGLAAYVEETRKKGAYPIIVTPLARNSWKADDGSYNDLLEQYADACIELGRQYRVPVVDLHGRSMTFVKEKGLEGAKAFFFPKDFTHTNDYGAYRMAGFVVKDFLEKVGLAVNAMFVPKSSKAEEIYEVNDMHSEVRLKEPDFKQEETSGCSKGQELERIEAYRRLAGWMAERADVWEGQGAAELPSVPERYRNVPKPDEDGVLFADLERPDDPLRRAEALDMVIKTARFFPTNVFNDLYEDIVGHEWYAGTVECAYQNGIIPSQMVTDHRFEPERLVTMEEFLVLAMSGYKSRKKMPEAKSYAGASLCEPYCVPYVRAAYSLGVVKEEEDLKAVITRSHAAAICRALDI